MASLETSSDILELLAVNEETIGRLYAAYADRFPEVRALWSSLAAEEKLHAEWVRTLKQKCQEDSLFFPPDRFKSAAIRIFTDYVANEISTAAKIRLTSINALSTAVDIEESLIERQFLAALETDSVELQHLFNNLETATRQHAQKLRDTWNQQHP